MDSWANRTGPRRLATPATGGSRCGQSCPVVRRASVGSSRHESGRVSMITASSAVRARPPPSCGAGYAVEAAVAGRLEGTASSVPLPKGATA